MARKSRRCTNCCAIATDDFNRANNDSLGANWSEGSGDGDIDSNQLLIPVGSEAFLIFQTAHPNGPTANQRVRVRFKLGTAGFIDGDPYAGVILGYADLAHFLWAAVYNVTAAGQKTELNLRLFKRQGGIDTEIQNPQKIIAEASDDAQWHTLEVCYRPDTVYPYSDGGVLRAKVIMASGSTWGSQATGDFSFTGDKVGLRGKGGSTTGVTRYDDFHFGWMQDEDAGECSASCPDCNTPCFIVRDDFAYDWGIDTDLGPDWDITPGGSWQRISDEAKQTAAGPGVMLCKTFHPQIKTHHHVTADLYVASGLKPRIIVNSNAAGTSYHWAQLELTGASANVLTLSVGKNGATLATKTSSIVGGAFVSLTVCYDGSVLTANANGAIAFSASAAVAGGIYVGLAGNSSGGGERFDNFVFQKHRSLTDPPDRLCPNCSEGLIDCPACCEGIPAYWLVDLTAIAFVSFGNVCEDNAFGGNGGCEAVGGAYVCATGAPANPCEWDFPETGQYKLCAVDSTNPLGHACCLDSMGATDCDDFYLGIHITLNTTTGDRCYYKVVVTIGQPATPDYHYEYDPDNEMVLGACSTGCGPGSPCLVAPEKMSAEYETDPFPIGSCPSGTLTLHKTTSTTGWPCKGTWPDFITMQEA